MRIDPKATTVSPVVAKTVRDAAAPRAPEAEGREAAAVVKLSSAGAAAVGHEDPAAKVARLRELVASGGYHVDLELLASRIVEADPFGD